MRLAALTSRSPSRSKIGTSIVSGSTTRAAAPLADAAVLHIRNICRNDRRHFGAAVPLQQLDAEFVAEGLRGGRSKLLGADNGVAQAREVRRFALAHVRPAERRCAHQDR